MVIISLVSAFSAPGSSVVGIRWVGVTEARMVAGEVRAKDRKEGCNNRRLGCNLITLPNSACSVLSQLGICGFKNDC